MSDNYNENDIEKMIFRDALASGEIEPSPKFWNTAFEGILQRENNSYSRRIILWRGAMGVMATIIILLAGYSIYMSRQINELKQQVTQIQTVNTTLLKQEFNQKTSTLTDEKASNSQSLSSGNTSSPMGTFETKSIASINKTNNHKLANSIVRSNYSTYPNYSKKHVFNIRQHIANNVSNLSASEPLANNSSNSAIKTPLSLNNPGTTNTEIANTVTQKLATTSAPVFSDSLKAFVPPQPKTTVSTSNAPAVAIKSSSPDTVASVFEQKKRITFSDIMSKASASLFYAPGTTNDFLHDKDNDPTHTITANVLKTREDDDGTFAAGLRLTYNFSERWALQTGCSYSVYSYNINPTVIYAQTQESGQVGYSIATSSGTIFLPYSAGSVYLGDSMKVQGKSSRGYISVPLQLRYNITMGRKLCFYTTGGFSVNIAKYQQTNIHWVNTYLQEGDVSVQSIYGLNTIHYSYDLGFGLDYILHKTWSIYAEPYLNGSFTSINKNTPVTTYPYFFGLALGITKRF